jgi:uncharacterized membrane protein YraQ (UPF0718 family)
MSGGHLVPSISIALLLGSLTSASYEVFIHMQNAFLGVGGRLGATAFLATAAVAKYQNVKFFGKRLRRGLWKSGAGLSSIVITMVLYHAIGAFLTILLRESSDDSGAADPVRASSVSLVTISIMRLNTFANDLISSHHTHSCLFKGNWHFRRIISKGSHGSFGIVRRVFCGYEFTLSDNVWERSK